jgi:GWxTD domain-containing protein
MMLWIPAASAMELVCVPAQWRHPESGPYVDLTLYLRPASTPAPAKTSNLQATTLEEAVRIEILIYDQQGIRAFDKYVLRKPVADSGQGLGTEWADLKRFYLAPGRYGLEVRATSLWDTLDKAVLSKELIVDTVTSLPHVSQPVLLHDWQRTATISRWVRSGYRLMAKSDAVYRRTSDTLGFYSEVHLDSTSSSRYLLFYSLTDHLGQVMGSRQGFLRLDPAKPVQGFLGTWPLSNLADGRYALLLELRDSVNQVVQQRTCAIELWSTELWTEAASSDSVRVASGQGIKAYDGLDSYAWEQYLNRLDSKGKRRQLASLRPICDPGQRLTLDRLMNQVPPDEAAMLSFVQHFWKQRSGDAQSIARWSEYQQEVSKTLTLFSSRITPGYETERGRVYLQYGPPNTRTVIDNEPSAFPYEVWWYYQIKGQRNVRFVFYNPDMVTNDYALLHSDAFGENSDPQWRLQLFSRTTAFQNLDNSLNRGHFGSHLDDHLRNQ